MLGHQLSLKKMRPAPHQNLEVPMLVDGEFTLGIRESSGEEGSGRRASPKEEKHGGCHSPQAGWHLACCDQTTRTRRTTVFEWLDDDEVLVAPPPSTKAPTRNTHLEVRSKRGEEVPEQ